jgi:hypothetical protein
MMKVLFIWRLSRLTRIFLGFAKMRVFLSEEMRFWL